MKVVELTMTDILNETKVIRKILRGGFNATTKHSYFNG